MSSRQNTTPQAGHTPRPAAATAPEDIRRGPRAPAVLITLSLIAALVFVGFFALGTWQVKRLFWKLDLIERVDQRVHAPAVQSPGPAQWPEISAANDEYRHVFATGTFLNDKETFVQAVTALGSGFWVLTPMQLADGTFIIVNRGFIPPEQRDPATRGASAPSGVTTVTGLLRITEPLGGFLRENDAVGNRWFSRDVQAIAAAHGLGKTAPYFIDAEAGPPDENRDARTWPAGGLTVISFPNNHLVYAITWYALALMIAIAAWYVGREERRLRQHR